jgi:nicotinamidase-related amidase
MMSNPTIPDPTRAALLVMDYQPVVLSNFDNAAELVERTATAIRCARAAGVKIVYVRVAFTAQDYAAIPSHNKAFAGLSGGGYLADESPETSIHADLAPVGGDVVVTKTRFGAFSTTNLAAFLNPREIDTLILAGLSTSGVVLSTVRDAADRDYQVLVLSDCCADPHAEVHRVLIEHVFPAQADLIETSALQSLLRQ